MSVIPRTLKITALYQYSTRLRGHPCLIMDHKLSLYHNCIMVIDSNYGMEQIFLSLSICEMTDAIQFVLYVLVMRILSSI